VTRSRIVSCALSCIAAALGGCGAPGTNDEAQVAEVSGALVDAARAVAPFGGPGSAETALIVCAATGHRVIAYNLNDPDHITTSGVTRGASIMGWSWSAGSGINDAFAPPQRLAPPVAASCASQLFNPDPCWPVLWGDPGLGQVTGTNQVFMTNLAVPNRQVPASGVLTGSIGGGACIARSVDGGQTFTISSLDCVHDAAYSRYDGSDVTGTVAGGPVFAAFRNSPNNTIDVYRAPTPTSRFVRLPNPFPGLVMNDHPRMRAMGGTLLLMAADASGTLWLQAYSGGGWGTISPNWPKRIATDYGFGRSGYTTVGLVTLRIGAQYDLAGTGRFGADPLVVVLYGAQTSGRSFLKEADCHPFSSLQDACSPGATIDPGVNAFHPALAVANITIPGSGGAFSQVWQAAWSQQDGTASAPGSQIAVYSGLLGTGAPALAGQRETGFESPCTLPGNYWGDYNTHVGVYQPSADANPLFWTAFADSTDATGASVCNGSGPINVSATWINYPGSKFDAGQFLDQNYNFSGSDWDPPTGPGQAYFKGQCSPGFQQLGLSKSPATGRTNSILCQMVAPSQFPGTYAAMLAVPGDQRRAGRIGDWDYGYYKLECGNNEYVSGSSENFVTHQFHAVRCSSSPGLGNTGCYTRAFDSSGAAGDGDWDPGFYKAECAPSEYVAGVSVDTASGDPHAVLCCPR
jgi:hypothetical protein